MWLASSRKLSGVWTRTKPLLVVEDDEDTRSFLRLTLLEWGYSVMCAEDGIDAMALARHITPALIILDLFLPRVDGFAFRSWLLEQPGLAQVPVIVMTAAGPAAADPVEDVATLYKPIDVDLLKAMLEVQLTSENGAAGTAGSKASSHTRR
jgi:DNA-binding response OmpR family regulator